MHVQQPPPIADSSHAATPSRLTSKAQVNMAGGVWQCSVGCGGGPRAMCCQPDSHQPGMSRVTISTQSVALTWCAVKNGVSVNRRHPSGPSLSLNRCTASARLLNASVWITCLDAGSGRCDRSGSGRLVRSSRSGMTTDLPGEAHKHDSTGTKKVVLSAACEQNTGPAGVGAGSEADTSCGGDGRSISDLALLAPRIGRDRRGAAPSTS